MKRFSIYLFRYCILFLFQSTYSQEFSEATYKSLYQDRSSFLSILPRDIQRIIDGHLMVYFIIEEYKPSEYSMAFKAIGNRHHINFLLSSEKIVDLFTKNEEQWVHVMQEYFKEESIADTLAHYHFAAINPVDSTIFTKIELLEKCRVHEQSTV